MSLTALIFCLGSWLGLVVGYNIGLEVARD